MNSLFKISIVIFLLIGIQVNAQFTTKTTGISSFSRFLETDTYFVLTDNDEVNTSIVNAVEDYWTISKSHIIDLDSFKIVSKDRDKSFVYFQKFKQKGSGKIVKTICLVNGGYDGFAKYITNALAYISLDNEGYEANDEDVIYRMGHIIAQIQDVVDIIKTENISDKTPEKVRTKMQKYYTARCKSLQQKILLIDKRYLNQKIIAQSEFEKIYKYDLRFVSKDFIAEAIKSKNASYAYLISALNLYKMNYVTDCESGKIIYVDFEEEHKVTFDLEKNFDREDIIQLNGHVKIGK